MRPVRVAVWDRSPSIRSLLLRILSKGEGLVVVEQDPRSLTDGPSEDSPDIVILGSDRPKEDLGHIERIAGRWGPRVVLLAVPGLLRGKGGVADLASSPVTLLPKPATPDGWDRLGSELLTLVTGLSVACGAPDPRPPGAAVGGRRVVSPAERRFNRVVIGASSGGPGALHMLLASLGRGGWPGIVVVQHITTGFEDELVRWLGRELEMDVALAREGEVVRPGTVRIAPPAVQLHLERGTVLRLDPTAPPRAGHRPSVDELFLSIDEAWLPGTLAILLDGMGRDGVAGLQRIRAGGGITVVQDPRSCVVGGMPMAAIEADAAELVLGPEEIGVLLREAGPGEDRR